MVRETISLLKKNPSPLDNKATIWESLNDQLTDEGTWDQVLINEIEKIIITKLSKLELDKIQELWENTEAAYDTFEDIMDVPQEKLLVDVKEDILNKVLDSLGGYYSSGDTSGDYLFNKSRKKEKDDEESDSDELFDDTIGSDEFDDEQNIFEEDEKF